ncbi:hypothetical protein Q8A73_021846 [Channa argus]|nr:hypothetical protein Q8A73_021846 [Channa argus]
MGDAILERGQQQQQNDVARVALLGLTRTRRGKKRGGLEEGEATENLNRNDQIVASVSFASPTCPKCLSHAVIKQRSPVERTLVSWHSVFECAKYMTGVPGRLLVGYTPHSFIFLMCT